MKLKLLIKKASSRLLLLVDESIGCSGFDSLTEKTESERENNSTQSGEKVAIFERNKRCT